MTPASILQVIGDKPICAALLRARFPKIESDARAERILMGMVEAGDLVRVWRGGRAFYKRPDVLPDVPDVDDAGNASHRVPRGSVSDVITRKLRQCGKATALDLAEIVAGTNEQVQLKAAYQRVLLHLKQLMESGQLKRTTRRPFSYWISTEQRSEAA